MSVRFLTSSGHRNSRVRQRLERKTGKHCCTRTPLYIIADTVARAGILSSTGPPSLDSTGSNKAERVPIADFLSDMFVVKGMDTLLVHSP